mmetsp:Transcript_64768/g.76038  ORF Transcript_64768/g.76038 Transcript_64768/m.76038 type:complete len:613 (+) Transcript_64768:81-1919(+)
MGAAFSARPAKIPVEECMQYLRKTPFFLYLSDETLQEFALCFPTAIKVNADQIAQLQSGNNYVVAKGELDLSTLIPATNPSKIDTKRYLCKKKPGDIINTDETKNDAVQQMSTPKLKNYIDNIVTIGCSKSLILCGDSFMLSKFLESKSNADVKESIKAITKSHITDYLSRIPFLSNIKESHLRMLAAMGHYEAKGANEVVFNEGTEGSKLYIVLHGVASVSTQKDVSGIKTSESSNGGSELCNANSADGNEPIDIILIADLKNGDYFGETALMIDVPRTTTVKTKQKSLFLVLDKNDFENFLMVCPIKESMLQVMTDRMLSKLSSIGIPFLVGIELTSLSTSVEMHEVPKDSIIFNEGDVGDRFYIIFYGEVKVEAKKVQEGISSDAEVTSTEDENGDDMHLGHLFSGQYFGEMALASDEPRSATVTAVGKTVLLSVGKESFHRLFSSNSQARAEFKLRLLQRSARLKHFLDHSSAVEALSSFLAKEFSQENLEFCLTLKEYRENTAGKEGKLVEEAKHIFNTFCADDASTQVNLPSTMKTELENALENRSVHAGSFENCENEIHSLMERDSFARFKKSTYFVDFFKTLGINLDESKISKCGHSRLRASLS